MRPDAEHELIRRVAAGDREAFAEIYRQYHPRLFRFVSRLTPGADVAEEVVNDVMVVVWRTAGRFRGASRLSSWILGIGYRAALKRARNVRRLGEQELEEEYVSDRESAEELLSRRERTWRIQAALQKLPPEQRAVVELTLFDGLGYAQIARIVDCPENTVKTRMFHARKRLKRLLRGRDLAHEEPK